MSGPEKRERAQAGVWLGGGLIVFAAIAGWRTAQIPSFVGYGQVGPTAIPWIVSALLAVLGAAIILQAWRGRWQAGEKPGAINAAALGWVCLGLLLNVVLIGNAGFILASTALFACAARAFGSRRMLRDAAIGFLLALACYAAFDRLLGYRIGTGVIENLI